MRRRKGSGAAAPRHRCHGCQPSSPRPRRSCHCARTPARIRLHSQEWCAAGAGGALQGKFAGSAPATKTGRQEAAAGGTGRAERQRGAAAGAAVWRARRPQPEQRPKQAGSRRRAERGTAAAAAGVARRSTAGRRAGSGKGGVARVAPRGRPARGTAAGQVGVQGANSQQRPR